MYRVEVLKVRTKAGVAKLTGMAICLVGAVCLAFYKGPHFSLTIWHHSHHQLEHSNNNLPSAKTWIKGCFLMLLSNSFWSLWLVFQVHTLIVIALCF